MARISGGSAFSIVTTAFTLTMLGTTMPTPLYSHYQAKLGFGIAMVTVIFAVYAVGVLAALLAFGRWSDTLGRKPLLLAGLIASAASDVVFLFADATWVLLLARIVSGLSAGVFVGTATAAVIEAAPDSWRGRAPLVATAANIGGLGLGPLVAGAFVDWFGSPLHLVFIVHLIVVAVVGVLLAAVPETVERVPGAKPAFQKPSVPAAARTTFLGAAVAGFAGFAVTGLLMAVSPHFVAEAVDDPSAILIGSVPFSTLAASVIAQVVLRRIETNTAVNVGCALLAVGTVILVVAISSNSLAVLFTAAIVAGAGQGLSFSKGLAALLAKVGPHERAGVTSAFFVVAYIAISLPVIGSGLAAQKWGVDPSGETFAGLVGVLAVLALVTLIWDQRRGAEL